MTNKLYVTPETEVLEVRFEENIMSPNGIRSNSASSGYDNDNDLGSI